MRQRRPAWPAAAVGLAFALALAPSAVAVAGPVDSQSDFNGDGYTDLAVGMPSEDVGSKVDAGSVSVLYGSRYGLTAAGDQLWNQDSPGVKGVAEGAQSHDASPRDRFGAALASADFDGDGYADLAVGSPEDRVGGIRDRGAVNVLYGSGRGLTAAGDQRLSRWDLPDAPDFGEWFGSAMAAADVNGDGFGDLVVGGTDGTSPDLRMAVLGVFFGGPEGLSGAAGQVITEVTLVEGGSTTVGAPRAAGPLDADPFEDVVIGAPGIVGGAVVVLRGSPTGLATSRVVRWGQDSPGVPDDAEAFDGFGSSAAIGDLDGDGWNDLAIGAPGEGLGDASKAVAVTVLYGTADGLSSARSEQWSQASPGIPGTPEAGDRLGQAVAACDYDGDGHDDLAIGVPFEGMGGAVEVVRGSPAGLTAAGARLWTQETPGVPGTGERSDRFGSRLGSGQFGYAGRCDLVIGNPRERTGPHLPMAGRATVLYGRATGLATRHAWTWSQDTRGVRDASEPYDQYGSVLLP